MPVCATTALIYAGAALAEIAGCFAFWAWLRQGHSPIWLLPGIASLIAFAWLLTLAPTETAGRAYAAYGGIYIVVGTSSEVRSPLWPQGSYSSAPEVECEMEV